MTKKRKYNKIYILHVTYLLYFPIFLTFQYYYILLYISYMNVNYNLIGNIL